MDAGEKDSGVVWYLGTFTWCSGRGVGGWMWYGSNMSSRVLSGRRRVFPAKAVPVVVPGYQLTFDMAGLPYWEPGFGTIQPAEPRGARGGTGATDCQVGEPLHCVAFLITRHELERIIDTEGGAGNPNFGYRLATVECTSYDGVAMRGVTLVNTERVATGLHPSPRYHGILMQGAVEHRLADEYIARLGRVQPYVPKTAGQRAAKYIAAALYAPLVLPTAVFGLCALAFGAKTPRAVGTYNEWATRLVWLIHDCVLAPVFGRGA
ncbi:hypothetical protein H4R18_004157 [Coemansia javaensis]|uniref:gamma-glutamylcyclotransferase n=1 Tax=Coemansia javaensis TaxID=2761396 RepID=A0A9W8H8H3_9FUNG|nr:hypothetical protein H4R18_004157 [Coemansia javaensis]